MLLMRSVDTAGFGELDRSQNQSRSTCVRSSCRLFSPFFSHGIVCCWADGKLSKKTSFITTTIVTTFRAREDDREHARTKATAVGDRFVLQHRKGEGSAR